MLNIMQPKVCNRFRVYFEGFGSDTDTVARHLSAQVLRVTRPHPLKYDSYSAAGVTPIELDLRDDAMDVTRTEVLLQLDRQIKSDAAFLMVIETLDQNEKVLERWRLAQSQIIDCHLDELSVGESRGLMIHLLIRVKQVSGSVGDQMTVMVE